MSNVYCCVYGCKSLSKRDKSISFHHFPKRGKMKVQICNKLNIIEKVDVRKAWILKLKMGKPVSSSMRVCSKHFLPEDYMPAIGRKHRFLKNNAVPSQNLPKTTHEIVKTSRPMINRKIDQEEKIEPLTCNYEVHEHDQVPERVETEKNYTNEEIDVANTLLSLNNINFKVDSGTQTVCTSRKTIFDNIRTDKEINALTGLHSLKLLETIEHLVQKYFTEHSVKRLNLRERIVLTFITLKHNFTYRILAILFDNISASSCQRTFYEMLTKLYTVLKSMIYVPSQEEISQNIPICFERFKNVRLIFDCTEIPVEKTKCLCCRIKCYSYYKSRNTLKVMLGVSPEGLINITYILQL